MRGDELREESDSRWAERGMLFCLYLLKKGMSWLLVKQ